MKHILFTAVLALSGAAHAQVSCQGDIDLLKSQMGSCNFGDQAACASVCSKVSTAPVIVGGGPVCTAAEIENARNQGRQSVINDLRAKSSLQATAYGIDQEDCRARVNQKASMLKQTAINDCNSKALQIKNCQIIGDTQFTSAAATVLSLPTRATVEYKAKSIDEANCRIAALQKAKIDALNSCKFTVGYDCALADDSTAIVTHKTSKPFLGETKRICEATIVAIPPANVTVQCTAEVRAMNSANGL